MASESTIEKVKTCLGTTTENEGLLQELDDIIESCKEDLVLAGVILPESPESNALILRAIKTFSKLAFAEGSEYDHLKRSYDEQKAQLKTTTGFTEWR